jgi:hypothetical protein
MGQTELPIDVIREYIESMAGIYSAEVRVLDVDRLRLEGLNHF